MIHTVYLDDEYINIQKLLKKMQRQKEGIRFENSDESSIAPEGYMSSEDFWKEADKRIIKVCKQYGVLYKTT